MNQLFILFAFLLVNFAATAQNDIEWGKPVRISGTEALPPSVVGISGNRLHSVTKTWRSVALSLFDLTSLNIETEYNPNLKFGEIKLKCRQYFEFNGRLFLITSYADEEEQSKEHFLLNDYATIGTKQGQELVAMDYLKLAPIAHLAGNTNQAENLNECSAMTSKNGKLLLVQYRKGTKNSVSQTILFDDQMKEVARNTLEIPFKGFTVSSVQFSDDGMVYILGHVDSDYKLLAYNAYSGEIEETEIETSIDLYSSSLKLMDDKSFVIYGIYKGGNSGNCGLFIQKLDENFQNVFSQHKKLSLELKPDPETLSDDQLREQYYAFKLNNSVYADLRPTDYLLHDLLELENGDLVFHVEEYSSSVTYTEGTRVISSDGTHSSSGDSHSTHYDYGDITTINCSKDGVIKWSNTIEKTQESRNDWGVTSSFFTIAEDNNLILIYNETVSNNSANLNLREANKNRKVISMRIDNSGNTNKSVLIEAKGKNSINVMPKQCQKLSDNSFLLYTITKGKKRMLGRLTLN